MPFYHFAQYRRNLWWHLVVILFYSCGMLKDKLFLQLCDL